MFCNKRFLGYEILIIGKFRIRLILMKFNINIEFSMTDVLYSHEKFISLAFQDILLLWL